MAKIITRTEFAECINETVEVHGSRNEGLTAVYVVDPAYGGLDILETLSQRQYDALLDELLTDIAEARAVTAEDRWDDERNERLLAKAVAK